MDARGRLVVIERFGAGSEIEVLALQADGRAKTDAA
jgi:hypothetical protein